MILPEPYGDDAAGVVLEAWDWDTPHGQAFLHEWLYANPYSVADDFLDGVEEDSIEAYFRNLSARPDSLFCAARVRGEVTGCVYLAGIRPGRDAWLNGYGAPQHVRPAIVAVGLLASLAFERLGLWKITTEHAVNNRAVGLVCERAGFRVEGLVRCTRLHKGTELCDTRVMGITRGDWEAIRAGQRPAMEDILWPAIRRARARG